MIVMVTGASGGIGKAAAELLAKRGHTVYGTYRSNEPQAKSWEALYMDVNDEESVKAAIEAVIKKEGRLDAVLNNAGMGVAGPLELTAEDEAGAQLDVNFLGAVVFSVIGYFYVKRRGKGKVARQFIPTLVEDPQAPPEAPAAEPKETE